MKSEQIPGLSPELAPRAGGPVRTQKALADEWTGLLAGLLQVKADGPSAQADGGEHTPQDQGSPSTDKTPGTLHSAEPQNPDAESDNRLTLTVKTQDLGQVSIVIDRAKGGVRVFLGVEGQTLQKELEPQKLALIQSLKSIGLAVDSVNVVAQKKVGTVLAQATGSRTAASDPKVKKTYSKHTSAESKHKHINVIG